MLYSAMMDAFLFSCGVHPTLELELEANGTSRSTRLSLRQPFAVVGRHPAADIYLDADGVRPRHLYFQAIEGRVACINVSHTGSFTTLDKEVPISCWLRPDQTVQIGSRSIKLLEQVEAPVVGEKVNDPLAPGSAWDIFAPRITLEIINEEASQTKKTWVVDRVVTLIGRTPRCALQLLEEGVSNVHCSLVLTTTGLWVVDLLGRGGIVINEQPVRVGKLGMDDELRLGSYRIRLQEVPVTLTIPKDESDYRPLTHMSELDLPAPVASPESGVPRTYHTAWPDDSHQATVLENMMDQFQEMRGSLFEQHQGILKPMIEGYSQLQGEQQEAVKNELDRLCHIAKEVESIEQSKVKKQQAGATDGSSPASETPPEPTHMSSNVEPGQPDKPTQDPASKVRSASSLLKGADSSVFRMPKKTGELFENASHAELPPLVEPTSQSWQYRETEPLSQDLAHEAQQLSGHQRGSQPPPFIPPQLASNLTASDQHRAARMDALHQEQSSIWKKLSKFFFRKS